jgi:hypothetical protein
MRLVTRGDHDDPDAEAEPVTSATDTLPAHG